MKRLGQHLGGPYPDQLPHRVEGDGIGLERRGGGAGQQVILCHPDQGALAAILGGQIKAGDGLQQRAMEHDALVNIGLRPLCRAHAGKFQRLGQRCRGAGGGQLDLGLDQDRAQGRAVGLAQAHPDHGRVIRPGPAVMAHLGRDLEGQRRAVQRQPARGPHLAQRRHHEGGAQGGGALGQHFDRKGQGHHRKAAQIGVKPRDGTAKAVIAQERRLIEIKNHICRQAVAICRRGPGGEQWKAQRAAARWHQGRRGSIGKIGAHDVAFAGNKALHHVEIGGNHAPGRWLRVGNRGCHHGRRGHCRGRDQRGRAGSDGAVGPHRHLPQRHRLDPHLEDLRSAGAAAHRGLGAGGGKRRHIQRHTFDRKLGQHVVHLFQPGATGGIDRQRVMRLAAQDVVDESRQVVARTAFQKYPRAIGVHLRDGLGKPHPARPLVGGQAANCLGVGGKGLSGQTGIDRQRGWGDRDALKEQVQPRAEPGKGRAVVGPLERQDFTEATKRRRGLNHPVARLGGKGGNHFLVGAVVHRQNDIAALGQSGGQGFVRHRANGDQGAACDDPFAGHHFVGTIQFAHLGLKPLGAIAPRHVGGIKRRIFAGRVPDHHVGLDPERGIQRPDRLVGRKDRLGADIHPPQTLARHRRSGVRVGGRKDYLAGQQPATMARKGTIDQIEPGAHFRTVQHHLAQHADMLTSLAGIHERQLAAEGQRLGRQINPLAVAQPGLASRKLGGQAGKLGLRVMSVGRDDGGAPAALPQRGIGLGGQPGQRHVGAQRFGGGVKSRAKPACIGGVEHQHLGAAGQHRARLGRTAVFFQHGMGVDAAKAEGVDPCAAWAGGPVNPRPGLGVEVERGLLQPQRRVWCLDQGRRQGAVIKRQRGLDQPRRPRSRQAMPDHRFHRAQGTGGGAADARAELPGQGLDFGRIAQLGGGAMGLDQPDRTWIDPGFGIGPVQRQRLTLDPGGKNAQALAVARHPHPAHQRIDAVARRLGVRQPLEAQNAHPFAQQGAVGFSGKRLDRSLARQGFELAEDHVDRGRGRGMHPPHHRHVAAPGAQVGHAAFQRDQ